MDKIIEKLEQLEQEINKLKQGRVYQKDIVFGAVKQSHIDGIIIFRGLAEDRPTNGDTEVQAWYSEDTKTLSIWNTVNEAWEVEVFT